MIPRPTPTLASVALLGTAWARDAAGRPPIRLPRTLRGNLQLFFFGTNDGLCAPSSADFADWLKAITDWDGPICGGSGGSRP